MGRSVLFSWSTLSEIVVFENRINFYFTHCESSLHGIGLNLALQC